jgi:hypothetical protein
MRRILAATRAPRAVSGSIADGAAGTAKVLVCKRATGFIAGLGPYLLRIGDDSYAFGCPDG